MNMRINRRVIVGIVSLIYFIAYVSNSINLVYAMVAPDKLVQKMAQNVAAQKGLLAEFNTPLKKLEPLYTEFLGGYQLNQAQIVDSLNLFGWISYEKETQKVSFQFGLKHISQEIVMLEYAGYYHDNNIYFYNRSEINPKRYVVYFEGKELLRKVDEMMAATMKEMIQEREGSRQKPKVINKNNSTTIVVPSNVKIMSKKIPVSVEIDEQLALNSVNLYLGSLNSEESKVESEPSMIINISTQIKEIPVINPHELIHLDATDLHLFLP